MWYCDPQWLGSLGFVLRCRRLLVFSSAVADIVRHHRVFFLSCTYIVRAAAVNIVRGIWSAQPSQLGLLVAFGMPLYPNGLCLLVHHTFASWECFSRLYVFTPWWCSGWRGQHMPLLRLHDVAWCRSCPISYISGFGWRFSDGWSRTFRCCCNILLFAMVWSANEDMCLSLPSVVVKFGSANPFNFHLCNIPSSIHVCSCRCLR